MDANQQSTGDSRSSDHRPALESRRILLIEDDRFCREGLAELFQSWGFEVDTASDGREGIKLGYLRPYGIAVIDIGLPDVNGYTVAQELRGLSFRTCPRLVALTGRVKPRDKHNALAAGFDVFLTKPASIDALKEVLWS